MKKKSTKKETHTPEYDSTRQQNVLLEKISSDVKTVAEGHSVLKQEIDKINKKLEEHDIRFDRIETVVMDNSKDIKALQKGQEEIKQKLDTVTQNHEERLKKLEVVS